MSNLLEQASLVMIPSGYKEDVVYSEIPINGAGDLSFTRASDGTRINSQGLVEVVPWNLATNSENFSAVYNPIYSTLSNNTTTAPNGTTTADSLLETTDVEVHAITTDYTESSGQEYTYSVYVKSISGRNVRVSGSTGFAGPIALVDLSNGSLLSGSMGASVESVGNGWYRISITATTTTTQVRVLIYSLNGTSTTFAGSTSNGVYIWGAQLNIGSTAKPYFPTTDRLNVPRLTYQNGGGGCPSLLLEKQSTNVNAKSNDFTIGGGYWYDYNGKTPIANQGTSPDGTNNAWSIPSNSYLTTEFGKTIGLAIGDKTAASIWAKGIETAFRLYIENVTNTDILGSVTVNLNTGAITSGSGTVEAYGNGWYKISTIGTSTVTNGYPRAIVSNPNTSCLIYGSQFEASSYATSYIPTTSSSATRVADACFKNSISSLIGQSSGVVFADIVPFQFFDGSYIGISDNGLGNRQIFGFEGQSGNSGTLRFYGFYTGNYGTLYAGQRYKIAMAYANNDFVIYVNGTQVVNQTSGTVAGTLSHFGFDSYISSSQNFQGQVNQAILFPTRLTNAELASLTTI